MKLNAQTRRRAIGWAVGLCLCTAPAYAQQSSSCPKLPNSSNLQWQEMRNPDLLFCKALDAAGKQVFTVMLSRESPFKAIRRLRAESLLINGQETWWYRTEIASNTELLAREASIELADGNIAYFNVQADDDSALQAAYSTVSALAF